MRWDPKERPGKTVLSTLDLRSLDPNEIHTIDLSVVELTQATNGAWQIIDPNKLDDPNSPSFGFDMSRLSSCSKWIQLKSSRVVLQPDQTASVPMAIRIPGGTRGFYCAGVMAAVRPRVDTAGVAVVLRFIVPVVCEIQGRPARNIVKATDVDMKFVPAELERPATTTVTMDIENTGMTLPGLKPVVRVWAFSGGHWRVITTAQFADMRIIPGAKLRLETDIRKSLPSGKYKIAGVLYVDGRRTKRVQKQVDFVGDTAVTTAASDAPLDLIPGEVTIDCDPGTTRAGTLKVYNGAEETVNVRAVLELPPTLQNIMFQNGVTGRDLNCTPWVKVTPEQFTLRGEGGKATMNLIATMPNSAVMHPGYYGTLKLWASYPDGQNAGLTTARVCVQNGKMEIQPVVSPQPPSLHGMGDSKYIVVVKFGNDGIVHFTPKNCKATVTSIASPVPRTSARLIGARPGLMLPSEVRVFNGVLDFSHVPADVYRLSAGLEFAPEQWKFRQIGIRVSIEGDERIVDVVATEGELPEVIKVKWSNIPAKGFFAKERS
jgi:hypothetical protein